MIFNLERFADNIAVIDESGGKYSYAFVNQECERLAENFIDGRCLVFNLCENRIGSLVGYVAALNNHIVPLLLDAHLDRGLLSSLIETFKPDYLWVPVEVVGTIRYELVFEANGYGLVKTPYKKVYPLYDQLALLLTTSGSTGSPKLVRQSYQNINANTESIIQYLDLNEKERPITTMPMSYTYGLSIINSHLQVGATVIMTSQTMIQKEFWQQFRKYEATSIGGVPYIYEMLEKLRFFRMDLPSLRTMTQAGGKLPPELHKKFAEFAKGCGKRFIVMYGQTEATARMSYLPPERSLEKCGSMGIAIPGGVFSLIDTEGNLIKENNVVGELVYEGRNVTLGYAEQGEDLNKGDEWNGKLVTGDMAKRDSDEFYYIVGRKKRFLKLYGSRINLDETERLLRGAFPEVDCACGGVDDEMFVFISPHEFLIDIQKYLSKKLGFHPSAFRIIPINRIPRSESGKILYNELL